MSSWPRHMVPSVDLYRALRPGLFLMGPESAHEWALRSIGTGAFVDRQADDPVLTVELLGKAFANPLGLAAGFDKNAQCLEPLSQLGFGFIEVGGVTPRPQIGNPKPRIFRETTARAVINRCGLNNDGLAAIADRFEAYRKRAGKGGPPIAVNLGPNADSENPIDDYAVLAGRLGPLADMLVVNVSSPNTTGLRSLQAADRLTEILQGMRARLSKQAPPRIGIKLTMDMAPEDLEVLGDFAVTQNLDAITLTNTSVDRPSGLASGFADQKGGLSGAPLKQSALAALRRVAGVTKGRIPLIGVGGIETGRDAYERIRAGASLLQIYTVLVFDGPGAVRSIKRGLVDSLRADGFSHVSEAVGVDVAP
ncbi:MAG: quinone-dependent dihydroorotate dehydrogenase [Pseudomonadota bacterium]